MKTALCLVILAITSLSSGEDNLRCGTDNLSCPDNGDCITVPQLCNLVNDCPGGQDEDVSYGLLCKNRTVCPSLKLFSTKNYSFIIIDCNNYAPVIWIRYSYVP